MNRNKRKSYYDFLKPLYTKDEVDVLFNKIQERRVTDKDEVSFSRECNDMVMKYRLGL